MSPFAARMQKLRKERDWTVAELARRAGVPYQAIRKLEAGDYARPAAERALAIADALGVPLSALTGTAAAPGFAEPAAVPLGPGSSPGQAGGDPEPALAGQLAPLARTPVLMRVTNNSAVLAGIWRDDLIVLDTGRRPRDGDLVVANRETDAGTGVTMIRRLAGPWLVSIDPDDPSGLALADGERIAVMGAVAAVLRRFPGAPD